MTFSAQIWSQLPHLSPANREISNETFLQEAYRILEEAEGEGILVRLMGSIAFREHCPKFSYLSEVLGRKLTDIDFATYGSQFSKLQRLMSRLDYRTDSGLQADLVTMGRGVYWSGDILGLRIDVFCDRLEMNHKVDFRGRLELDRPTIPLTELLQEKMQIVQLNWKDVKDMIMLLREHELSPHHTGGETIDISHVSKILSEDWGYYHTFTTNIKTVQAKLTKIDVLSEEDKRIVLNRLSQMLEHIEKQPKSLTWKIRARVGTKKTWYREVSELNA